MTVRRPASNPAPEPLPGPATSSCGYVTDGARLFRVIAPLDPEHGVQSAVLEDCATLRWQVFPASELYRLRLRSVRPTART